MLLFLFNCFVIVAAINILYYLSFSNFLYAKDKSHLLNKVSLPVSIIVCAKNESENLKKNLPKLLQQDYPEFEIILINDSSSDDSLEVMEEFELKDARITIVNVQSNERFWGNKKYALTLGIKKAKFEQLLFTDADCYPSSSRWILEMMQGFQTDKSLVLGYGGYELRKKSFLNKIIRFETLLTAIQYFSAAKRGRAYMGVGRNLAYTATEFYENNGFVSHMNILSGDDDLFVNQVATKKNTSIILPEDSFTYSPPKLEWKEWFKQKRRHVSTANHYKKIQQLKLGLFYLSQLLFWLLSFTLIFFYDWKWVLSIFLLRTLVLYFVYSKATKIFKEKDLMWILPFQDLALVLLQIFIFMNNFFSKPIHWK